MQAVKSVITADTILVLWLIDLILLNLHVSEDLFFSLNVHYKYV